MDDQVRDYCVYMHVFGNGNKYIGITNNPEIRFRNGFNINKETGKAVYKKWSYNKYVINSFNDHGLKETVFLHENVKAETAKILEIIQIDMHNTLNIKYGGSNLNGLNMDKGGLKGGNSNSKYSNDILIKVGILLEEGLKTDVEISIEVGIPLNTINNWRNGNRLSERFEELGFNIPFPKPGINDEELIKIGNMFDERIKTDTEISNETGILQPTINKYRNGNSLSERFKELGFKVPFPKPGITDEELIEIGNMFDERIKTDVMISKETGIPRYTINNYRNGIYLSERFEELGFKVPFPKPLRRRLKMN